MTLAAAEVGGRGRNGVGRWGISLLLVLGVHAAVALLLMSRRPPLAPPAAPPAAVMIDLAPLPPAAPAEAPARQPEPIPPPLPEPTPPPPPELALPPPPPLTPAHPAVTLPKPPPPRKQPLKPRPQPAEQPPAPTAVPPPTAPPPAAPQPAPPGPSVAAVAARANWQAQLMAWLSRQKRYPRPAQEQRQQGTAYLRFSLDRGGRVLSARLERSSGFPLLDEEVLALIQRAQPLPPPPTEVAGERFELLVPVAFSIQR